MRADIGRKEGLELNFGARINEANDGLAAVVDGAKGEDPSPHALSQICINSIM